MAVKKYFTVFYEMLYVATSLEHSIRRRLGRISLSLGR